jgi:GGDEF domain-containing protein
VLPSGDALPPITVSIGISQAHLVDTLENLFIRADEALKIAKACGGNNLESKQ